MSDQVERVAVPCPSCSPDLETVHEALATGGGMVTARCTECGHVHKEPLEREETVELSVVISQDGESFTATVDAPADETLAVGEEFVADTPEAIMAVRITDLEVGPERRADEAHAAEVETVWTRAVDNVSVDVTLHPADGSRDRSRGVTLGVPGDHEFAVGSTEELGEEAFTVEGIHVRDDAVGYPTAKLDRRGDAAPAKDVARIYGRDASSSQSAWSGW